MSEPCPSNLFPRTELLSPAGDWDCLRAAVANGADAVYFGLKDFSARHRAVNFSLEELDDVVAFLHGANVRAYVTCNTLIFSDELAELARLIEGIATAGADAMIVQDLGLARLARAVAGELPLHASTQMTLTDWRSVALAEELGISRVILARELSIAEIESIAQRCTISVEVFVHGALCVAYSGQCLTSEALGGRSANRGQCAQACRLPYDLVVDGQVRPLADQKYLLSPLDLASHDLVEPLVRAGVACLKIEGRLKTPEYVAATTSVYRRALDAALAAQPFHASRRQRLDLQQGFSRGFSTGFLEGANHQVLAPARFPKSRGVRVGTVVERRRDGLVIELAAEHQQASDHLDVLKPGDGIVLDEGHPEALECGGRVLAVESWTRAAMDGCPRQPDRIWVELLISSNDLAQVSPGALVWKTDDPGFRKRMRQSFARVVPCRRTRLQFHLAGRVGEPLVVTVRDDSGRTATRQWPGPLCRAIRHPLDEAVATSQLGRLGETPYELGGVTLDFSESVIVPLGVLNRLRRELVEELSQQDRATTTGRRIDKQALCRLRSTTFSTPAVETAAAISSKLNVLVRTWEQLEAVLAWKPPATLAGPPLVYCDFEDVRRYHDAVLAAHAAGRKIGVSTLRIAKPHEEGLLRSIDRCGADAILIRSLGAVHYLRGLASGRPLVGDFSLNVTNELTADLIVQWGLARITPSYDLSWEQFQAFARRMPGPLLEAVVHQHLPMFHMEHCVFAATLSSGKDWRDCGRPCDRHKVELRDRAGANFPLAADTGCRNTVYNALPQSAMEYLPRMQSLGLSSFRVELLRESAAEVPDILDRYARVLAGEDRARDAWRGLMVLDQLGVTRGTLHAR